MTDIGVSVCVALQMTLQQICADVNRVKTWGQQAYLNSSHKISFLGKQATGKAAKNEIDTNVRTFFSTPTLREVFKLTETAPSLFPKARLPPAGPTPAVRDHEENRKQTHIPSYQQINCVDNIIRSAVGSSTRSVFIPGLNSAPHKLTF